MNCWTYQQVLLFFVCLLINDSLSQHIFLTKKSLVHSRVNYYDLLGVPRNASEKEIKKAYTQVCQKIAYNIWY